MPRYRVIVDQHYSNVSDDDKELAEFTLVEWVVGSLEEALKRVEEFVVRPGSQYVETPNFTGMAQCNLVYDHVLVREGIVQRMSLDLYPEKRTHYEVLMDRASEVTIAIDEEEERPASLPIEPGKRYCRLCLFS